MQHPRTRAERRHARETWRNRRRKIIVTRYTGRNSDPTEDFGWLKAGKQYTACGNRCAHRFYERREGRTQVKALRRANLFALAEA
jgi:hypothetical protein